MPSLEPLLPPEVALVELARDIPTPPLYAEEERSILAAGPRRRHEFALGRLCARRALEKIGIPPAMIPVGPNHMPVWPDGAVGSITHSNRRVAAAVAKRSTGIRSIGIDVEEVSSLEPELWPFICAEVELTYLESQQHVELGNALRIAFSVKEAVFKCQYPISGQMLEFSDVRLLRIDPDGAFLAKLMHELPGFPAGFCMKGTYSCSHEHIASAVVLREEELV